MISYELYINPAHKKRYTPNKFYTRIMVIEYRQPPSTVPTLASALAPASSSSLFDSVVWQKTKRALNCFLNSFQYKKKKRKINICNKRLTIAVMWSNLHDVTYLLQSILPSSPTPSSLDILKFQSFNSGWMTLMIYKRFCYKCSFQKAWSMKTLRNKRRYLY